LVNYLHIYIYNFQFGAEWPDFPVAGNLDFMCEHLSFADAKGGVMQRVVGHGNPRRIEARLLVYARAAQGQPQGSC